MKVTIRKLEFLKFFIHQMVRVIAVGWMVMVFVIFIDAYSNPEKVACVNINMWGEANLEIIMLCLGIPLIISFLLGDVYNDLRELKRAQSLKSLLPTIDT